MSKIILILSLFFASCLNKHSSTNEDCIKVGYNDSTDHFKVIKKLAFDTTASLVYATVIDVQSRRLLSGVQMQIQRGEDGIKARTGKEGTVKIFRNGIEGVSEITFWRKGYSCLTIKRFEIEGGQLLSVRLRKR